MICESDIRTNCVIGKFVSSKMKTIPSYLNQKIAIKIIYMIFSYNFIDFFKLDVSNNIRQVYFYFLIFMMIFTALFTF